MKKIYEKPTTEKIAFCYKDQVVVASSDYPGGSRNADGGEICRHQTYACSDYIVQGG